jgi:hypothetical protein
MQTVQQVLALDPTGHYAYNNDLDGYTKVIDCGVEGYAVYVGGYYSLAELELVVKNLKQLNQLQPK